MIGTLRVALAFAIVFVSTVVHVPIVVIGALFKAALPIPAVRRLCDRGTRRRPPE